MVDWVLFGPALHGHPQITCYDNEGFFWIEIPVQGLRHMEMHQIRYFIAVAQTLNFTRAAEACNVSQPSLTRAIKNLEAELGGEMFRRERANTHLTELGRAMLPLLTSSFEAANAAKEQAEQLKSGKAASLRLALTQAIDFDIVADALTEVGRVFSRISLSCQRIAGGDVLESLRNGEIEVALAGPLAGSWDRLDSWTLFVESHCVLMRDDHPLAGHASLDADSLIHQRLILRPYCQQWSACATLLQTHGIELSDCHEVTSDRDVYRMLEVGLGIAVVPLSTRVDDRFRKVPLSPSFEKEIRLYTVAGRERSKALVGLINLLRSSDWSRFSRVDPAA